MPVVPAPEALFRIRSADNALAARAAVDNEPVACFAQQASTDAAAEGVRPVCQGHVDLGVAHLSPPLVEEFRGSAGLVRSLPPPQDGSANLLLKFGHEVGKVLPNVVGQDLGVVVFHRLSPQRDSREAGG
jgi:hypothetical protein